MNLEEYYGADLIKLRAGEKCLLDLMERYPGSKSRDGIEPILYCNSRIKSADSMRQKLRRRGQAADSGTALRETNDALGVRVICSFMDDVYQVAGWLRGREEFEIINEKDYISYPKPNGYRSLHLILRFRQGIQEGMTAEIQLRTIAIDFWAALEHQMKYKKNIEHENMIRDELKRCADEIASIDMSMQTIRDILQEQENIDDSA